MIDKKLSAIMQEAKETLYKKLIHELIVEFYSQFVCRKGVNDAITE